MTSKDIKRIRAKFGLSQSKFAGLLGISTRTLQHWEQGRRPGAPGVALLGLAESRALKKPIVPMRKKGKA